MRCRFHVAAISALFGTVAALPDALAQSSAPASQAESRPASTAGATWTIYRGNSSLVGVAEAKLPEKLKQAWRKDLPDAVESSAAIGFETVFVGCDDSCLYALDLTSGAERWKYKATEAIKSAITLIDDMVCFGDDVGMLHAVDAKTGAIRWTRKTGGEVISAFNRHGDRLVVGSYDGNLYCLNKSDGAIIWQYTAEDKLHATPAIVGDYALISGCDANLHVIRLSDGQVERKIDLGSPCGAAAATRSSRVYVGTYGAQVFALDWRDGQRIWTFADPTRDFPYMSSAAVTDDWVVVGGRDKRIRGLSAKDGTQRWEIVAGSRVDSSPVIVGDRVFVGASDGVLYGIKLVNGEIVWRFEAGAPIVATPAVVNGRLVIATLDGAVYCFAGE